MSQARMSRNRYEAVRDRNMYDQDIGVSKIASLIMMPNLVKYLIEFGAALALVLFVGVIEDDQKNDVVTSAAYGIIVATLMFMFSAQHFNAWFTIYAFIMDLMKSPTTPSLGTVLRGLRNVLSIIAVQIAGSVCGAWFLSYLHNSTQRVGTSIPRQLLCSLLLYKLFLLAHEALSS